MKIAFRIEISSDIGMGHYMRMSALAEAFTQFGHTCTFYSGDDEPIDYSYYNVIVLDSYELSDKYISTLRKPGCTLVCYDDNALYNYNCDVLLNANFHAHELEYRFQGMHPKLLLGSKYALLRSEFKTAKTITIRKNANRIFICFGGSDSRDFTPFAIEALRCIPDVRLTVVLGEYTKCDEHVISFDGGNVDVLKNPSSLSSVMGRCDIAVTAVGSMVYELAALGIPSIVVLQADNQYASAGYLDRNNLMKWVGNWDSVTAEELRAETESLLYDTARREMEHKELIQAVDKNGAQNAAIEILDMIQKGL